MAFANDVAPDLPFVEMSSFWLNDQPAVASNPNNVLVELGVKVRSNRDGLIEGLHYFNGDVNVTTHTAKLWTSDGDLLMSEVFTNTPEIRWLDVMFTTPVSIAANTTYVMSYDTTGAFPSTSGGLVVPPRSISPAMRALTHDEDGGNGVYAYGSGFPNAALALFW